MLQKVDLLKVFISCPGDVDDERKIIRNVCKDISNVTCKKKGVEIKPLDYKENIIPLIGYAEAQSVINDQLEEEGYDVYIGIMWHKFGDPLKSGVTPTESEFYDALGRYRDTGYPFMQFYFKNSKYTPLNDDDKEQLKKVASFKSIIQKMNLGMYKSFKDALTFQSSIFQFLFYCVEKIQADQSQTCSVQKSEYDAIKFHIERSVVKSLNNEDESFLYKETAFDLIDVVKTNNKVVLIGDAGIGKTSELKRVANHFSDESSIYYPFWVSLNTYIDQEIENLFKSDWEIIPSNLVLFIFDGFDEIESKFKYGFIKRLELFSAKHPEIKLLLSCRTNFYKIETDKASGTFRKFKSIFLEKLNEDQIVEYSKKRLGSKHNQFLEIIKRKKLADLMGVPFYLVSLLEIFENGDGLQGDRPSVIDELIQSRLNFDVLHFRQKIDLEKQKKFAIERLKDIALVMETLGRNYISEDEYKQIITDDDDREVLSHCTAWKNRPNSLTWEFEHNYIQEYFAAKRLQAHNLSQIKKLVAFEPSYNRIIPSWVNTISFLLSVTENQGLIDWILEIEPEIIIKSEPGRIEESRRFNIVKNIFNSYRTKKIWISNDKFGYGELGAFCNSEELIDFLVKATQEEIDPVISGNAIKIIGEMKIPYLKIRQIQDFLLGFVADNKSPDFLIGRSLIALSDLKIVDKGIADEIVKILKSSTNDWIRYGLYQFLNNSGFVDEHISVFLDGIKYISTDSDLNRLLNERLELIKGLELVIEPEALKSVITFMIQSKIETIHFIFDRQKHIQKIIENLSKAYNKDKSLYKDVLNLIQFSDGKFSGAAIICKFFIETKTQFRAFKDILKEGIKQHDDILSKLADKDSLEYITQMFRDKNISQDDVQFFLNSLEFNQNNLYEPFFETLNCEYNDQFKKRQKIDFAAIRKEQSKKDIEILFDRDLYIREVELIFNESKLETLNHDYFSDLQFNYRTKPRYASIVIRGLSKLSLNEDLNLEGTLQLIKTWNWEWFWISNMYRKINDNPNEMLLSENQKENVISWCYDQIPTINFKKAIKKKGPSTISINNKESYLWFFFKKYKLEFPSDVLLDMISFDFTGDIIPFLENGILSIDQMTLRILDNLYKENLCRAVLENHLKFCQKHKIKDVIAFVLDEIVNPESDLRYLSLDLICGLSDDLGQLFEALSRIEDDFKWNVIDALVESKYPKVEEYLNQIFSTGESEEKYRSAMLLIRLQKIEAISFYVGYLKKQETFTRDQYNNSPFGFIQTIEAIHPLLDLYEACLKEEITNEDINEFDTLETLIKNSLKTIALSEDGNFKIVKTDVESFIKKHIYDYDRTKWLYPFIEQIEMQYYINKSKNISIEDAISKVKQFHL